MLSTDNKPEVMHPNDGRLDVERAIHELSDRLPGRLRPLARLAYNYRWAWIAGGATVFRTIDPANWQRCGCNPRAVIEAASPRRLQELAKQEDYVEHLHAFADELRADLSRPCMPSAITPERPVAYFCSEFGVHCSLPVYGGGLGILAGDVLKSASDLAFPMVGIGLVYRQGYFRQRLHQSGWQIEYWNPTDFERLPAVLVTGPDQEPVTFDMKIRNRTVHVQIWRVDVGRVPLYLLDTDREDNHIIDRWITARLYTGDRQTRVAQYAVLGIGGVRALDVLGIQPSLIHLNEGHAALSGLERVRRLLRSGCAFDDAVARVRQETVFTTHTPVAAGNEGYHRSELEFVLADFLDHLGEARTAFFDLGRVNAGSHEEAVSITPLALRISRAANGVSRRHAEVARAMWQPLWPALPAEQVPISAIVNGVHVPTWMSNAMQHLFDEHLGAGWRERLTDAALWERVMQIPDDQLWAVRCTLRELLIDFVREQSVRNRMARGEPSDYVEAAALVFDPGVFTIGFARRVVTYKRLHLLTRFPDRSVRLLQDSATPIQVVVAGKAHPEDREAKEALRDFFQLKRLPGVAARIVFLEDYDLHLAPRIVAGVDLWLNLPRPPLEASGTSGMKVTLNGGLNLSVLDGWWAEAYDGENGWAIDTPQAEPHVQDDHDAHQLLDLLEREVLPLFFERDDHGIPHRWLHRVKHAMSTLIPRFSAERMLRDYIATMYSPKHA